MKRHLMTLILGGFLGSLVLVGNAEACHKKKCQCASTTCTVVVSAPCPPPAPVCQPVACAPKAKKCGGLFAGFKGHKGRKAACAGAATYCETVVYQAPVSYSYPAPTTYSSPQTSAQH
jgi:hypothetical protein